MTSAEAAESEMQLENVLQRIEAEPLEACRARGETAFDEIAGDAKRRLVLFGAGPLGKIVLEGLRRVGIEPLAFADNRIKSAQVMGVPVLGAKEAVERYGDSACFVITVYQGSSIRSQLASLRCERVAPFAKLFWKHGDVFTPQFGIDLPHRLRKHFEPIRSGYATLADVWSRRELREQLLWRNWLDYSTLSQPLAAAETYFPLDLISPLEDEVLVDCGSFQGDTIPSFLTHWKNGFRRIFALEPDALNREVLAANVGQLGVADRVTVLPYAVGSENGELSFAATGTVSSQIVKDAGTGATVECRRLDAIEWPVAQTYIKMDIEGAEPEALEGAAELLRREHPVLAVCTYHRSEHLWEIPSLIRSIAPQYNLFLRRYAEECWEGVCYAIPNNRVIESLRPSII